MASFLGRDWLSKIHLDWTKLCNNHAYYSLSVQDILAVNSSVFSPELGTLKDAMATIVPVLKKDGTLRICGT